MSSNNRCADGYENALNDVVLQRILLLVLLLDRAQIISSSKSTKNCSTDASIKSTKELAQKLLTAMCYGEGDILRT